MFAANIATSFGLVLVYFGVICVEFAEAHFSIIESKLRPLAFDAVIETTGDWYVTWQPSDGTGIELQASGRGASNITLLRFSPLTDYTFTLNHSEKTDTIYATSGSSGIPEYDQTGQFAVVNGTFTSGVLVFDRAINRGLVGIEASTGKVVWLQDLNGGGDLCFDQLDDFSYCTMVPGGNNGEADSNVTLFSSTGQVKKNSMSPALSHELFADNSVTPLSLATYYAERDGLELKQKIEKIVKVDLATGEQEVMIDLGLFFDPVRDRGLMSTPLFPEPLPQIDDWLHANSVERAHDGTGRLVVSLRHLSAVAVFSADGSKLLWVLSSELDAFNRPGTDVLQFDRNESKFYNQHSASIIRNGNLLLFECVTYLSMCVKR